MVSSIQVTLPLQPAVPGVRWACLLLAATMFACPSSAPPDPSLDITGETWQADAPAGDATEVHADQNVPPDALPEVRGDGCPGECLEETLPVDAGDLEPADLADGLDLTDASEVTAEVDAGDLDTSDIEATRVPGQACTTSAQCLSGDCSDTPLGRFCAPLCASGCPKGWVCKGDQPDSTCEPKTPPNCWSCDAKHCPLTWCHPLGTEGEFCLAACLEKSQCPAGYTCEPDPSGLSFCTPPLPSCACAPSHIGFSVPCDVTNQFGSCPGSGVCTETGLASCEGPTPQLEICDGIDNNCDGAVDENFPDKSKPCDGQDPDLCLTGIWTCGPGGLALVCSGEKPQLEVCDDKDNTCDGVVDEGFEQKGEMCGVSPFCGVGYWACHPTNGKLYCKGVTPEPEVCDGKDNDCNGLVDEGFPDADGNGFAECP